MLFFFSGEDRNAAHDALNVLVQKHAKDARVVRITDVHSAEDARAALQGAGLFGGASVPVFDDALANAALAEVLFLNLESIRKAAGPTFVYESAPPADVKKKMEKYAQESKTFPLPRKGSDDRVFDIASALKRKDKKAAWVSYVREISRGKAAEAIHGVMFWAAKDMHAKSKEGSEARRRAEALLLELAALPHEARRKGVEFEYALEDFVLSGK